MTKAVKPIDQAERVRLCRAILDGDTTAVAALAQMYEDAGYKTLAGVLRTANDFGKTHANAVLS